MSTRVMHIAAAGVLLFALLSVIGCRENSVAYVVGTVSVEGVPLDRGWVVFRDSRSTLQGEIKPGGGFTLHYRGSPKLPCGKYGVAIVPPETEVVIDPGTGVAKPGPPPDVQTYPLHCRSTETSGIVQEFGTGRHVLRINFSAAP